MPAFLPRRRRPDLGHPRLVHRRTGSSGPSRERKPAVMAAVAPFPWRTNWSELRPYAGHLGRPLAPDRRAPERGGSGGSADRSAHGVADLGGAAVRLWRTVAGLVSAAGPTRRLDYRRLPVW